MNTADRLLRKIGAPSNQRVKELLMHHAHTTENMIRKTKPENMLPILLVVSKADFNALEKHHAIGLPFSNPEEKTAMMRFAGAKFHEEGNVPMAFFLAAEAWTVELKKEDKIEGPVSKHPNKKEVIQVSGLGLSKNMRNNVFTTMMFIGRDSEGRITPGDGWEPITENGSSSLLDQFWIGYFHGDRNEITT